MEGGAAVARVGFPDLEIIGIIVCICAAIALSIIGVRAAIAICWRPIIGQPGRVARFAFMAPCIGSDIE